MKKVFYCFSALLLLAAAVTTTACSHDENDDEFDFVDGCSPEGDYTVKLLSKDTSGSGEVEVVVVSAPEGTQSHFKWPRVGDRIRISDYGLQFFYGYAVGETLTIQIADCYYFGSPPHYPQKGCYYCNMEDIVVIKNKK